MEAGLDGGLEELRWEMEGKAVLGDRGQEQRHRDWAGLSSPQD